MDAPASCGLILAPLPGAPPALALPSGQGSRSARFNAKGSSGTVNRYGYDGPSISGYETDAPLRRAAFICVHTSPLAAPGQVDAGGMNVYVRDLACQLARLGLEVDIFTRRTHPQSPELTLVCPGVRVINVTAGPAHPIDKNEIFPYLPDFATEAALFSLRHGVRYDIIHSHYWLSGWAAHLLRQYWDTPFVHMFHTTAHMKNAVVGSAGREPDLRLQFERRLIQLSDSLIAANPAERADLIWRQHIPTDKVCTVPPGVDLDLFYPRDRTEARGRLGLDVDAPIVLFVGRVDPIKGIDTLLEAVRHLAPWPEPPPTVVFVGGELDELGRPMGALAVTVEEAANLGVADHFRFVGSQPQDQLPYFYAAADVVAVPSRYESFGLVAVEAMASGTPVVASRAGGLTFTVEDGVAGLLVPPQQPKALAAALRRVLLDDRLRADLSEGALQCASRFAWPAVATSILHIYERLAEGQRANLCCDEEIYA